MRLFCTACGLNFSVGTYTIFTVKFLESEMNNAEFNELYKRLIFIIYNTIMESRYSLQNL